MTPPAPLTFQQVAMTMSRLTSDDKKFVEKVNYYVHKVIRYETTGGWEVRSPERCWREGRGDCSEMALLIVEMLKIRGIEAQVVHGYLRGQLHDTVEYRLGKHRMVLDEGFSKIGNGLHPREKVVP
jgi:transglutaminase-like putative cysteine protease